MHGTATVIHGHGEATTNASQGLSVQQISDAARGALRSAKKRRSRQALSTVDRDANVCIMKSHMTPKKRYGFWAEEDQIAGLRKVKERDGVLESEQIRRAIDDWLAKKGVKKTGRKRVAARKRP